MMLGHMSLSGRGRQIVDHVGRYRMTTNAVVHRQFLAGRRANAVTKVTLRLCEGDYLRSFPLYHPKRYFTLGLRGATLLGLPPNRTLPLGPQTLPTEYGILAFALLGQARHERLTSSEFIARYPGTPQHVAEQCYCVDASRQTLELVRVDLGESQTTCESAEQTSWPGRIRNRLSVCWSKVASGWWWLRARRKKLRRSAMPSIAACGRKDFPSTWRSCPISFPS